MSQVPSPMSNVQCLYSNIQCLNSSIQCPKSKLKSPMSNVLTAEFPDNSLSAGARLWSSSILFTQLLNTWRVYSRLTNFINQSETHELGCSTFMILSIFVSRDYWVFFVSRDFCLKTKIFSSPSPTLCDFGDSHHDFRLLLLLKLLMLLHIWLLLLLLQLLLLLLCSCDHCEAYQCCMLIRLLLLLLLLILLSFYFWMFSK